MIDRRRREASDDAVAFARIVETAAIMALVVVALVGVAW